MEHFSLYEIFFLLYSHYKCTFIFYQKVCLSFEKLHLNITINKILLEKY